MRTPSWLWPVKTGKTLLDVWTVCHIAFWLVLGFNLAAFHASFVQSMALCYLGACVWEVVERYGEKFFPEIWAHPEKWWNSWIGDALIATTVGAGSGWLLCSIQ